jgi:hypothetical protein
MIRQAFERQAVACETLGSPFTARLCRLAAARLETTSRVEQEILSWPNDPTGVGDALALRLAGALHALVLSRQDEALASVYPPHEVSDDELWRAVGAAMKTQEEFISNRLRSAPQTNEIRRSSALLPGFMTIAQLFSKPLDLLEIGASAGLNLQWDRYHYRLVSVDWGDPVSPVHLQPKWEGAEPPAIPINVRHRRGCDLNPLDPTSAEDGLRLMSYVWADQRDRMERLEAALSIAASSPPPVDRNDALSWLPRMLSEDRQGAVTVIYHTIAWQYLPPEDRAKGEAIIADAGSRASPDAPLARLELEADDNPDGAALRLQVWPGGKRQEIGRADFHGRWVKWTGWQ